MKKSIPDKSWNEIPYSTSLIWRIIWHKHKAHKEVAFLWLVIHKVVVVNEWRVRILAKIDMSCPIVAHQLWSQWSTNSLVALWLNKCGVVWLTSVGNS
jgi:hypothetical protein